MSDEKNLSHSQTTPTESTAGGPLGTAVPSVSSASNISNIRGTPSVDGFRADTSTRIGEWIAKNWGSILTALSTMLATVFLFGSWVRDVARNSEDALEIGQENSKRIDIVQATIGEIQIDVRVLEDRSNRAAYDLQNLQQEQKRIKDKEEASATEGKNVDLQEDTEKKH